ncbi:ATPase WRNIP1-like isoform X2 [Dendronephthya gigantea]|uniref:ATPase WRNIP1-like isoform X2 n=1 Tax=Dendronephthya gigantea TaxID=151771 RepID=UPI00106C04A7|nr:ATPase WRNIP1-like isoform X2 [Dendronephthya gigantea]
MAQSSAFVNCPVCSRSFVSWTINQHIEECLQRSEDKTAPSGSNKNDQLSTTHSLNTLSKSPEITHNRKSLKSTDSGSCNRLSNSPEIDESTKNMASFRSPPLKRAKVESFKTGPVVNTQTKGGTSKQNDQTPRRNKFVPLAEKLRPKTLEEYVGQAKVLGERSMLKKLLESHDVPSMIFWGPPGCGKTTLANIIANNTKQASAMRFVKLSATMSGVAEVKEVIKIAKNEQSLFQRKTILFVDEIHRFNKMQQDTFLPHVENGTITMIGATTENPSFHVNTALLSRCRVIVLEKLSTENLMAILASGVSALGGVVCDNVKDISLYNGDESRDVKIAVEKDSLRLLANLCDGDARNALNGLEMAVQSKLNSQQSHSRPPLITVADTKESFQRSHVSYDRNGEEHYNIISALHKSVRGGDDNAALYWLGRMLVGGEDPMYIARRLVRMASEDIGLADPQALNQAVSAFQACHFIGRPECDVILAQAAVYLARAPKSVEVYKAYGKVAEHIKSYEGTLPGVPLHLRNAPTKLMKNLGYSKGYKYNPDYDGPVDQEYLPSELKGIDFFKDGK